MIKVGLIGYGTIGKRVADAVALQKDMKLVGITGHSYSYKMEIAKIKGYKIYAADGAEEFTKMCSVSSKDCIEPEGDINNLLDEVDVIVDATPKKIGLENKEKYYLPKKIKAIFEGGEKHETVDASFVAQCNYDEALNKNYVRVVSCNTTGLCRTLNAVNQNYGISSVHATMVRRAADPWDIRHGPINSIVPVLELPSHHGPDVQTVLHDVNIFTTAMSVPTTLMHMHSLIVDLKKKTTAEDVLNLFKETTRIRVACTLLIP